MTLEITRTLRMIKDGEQTPRPAQYWRKRPLVERLQETLSLHREGNALFKNGNPPFSYVIRIIDVGNS